MMSRSAAIGGDLRMCTTGNTLGYSELMRQVAAKRLCFDSVNSRERRRLVLQAIDKRGDRSLVAADTDEKPLRIVQDFARKAQITRNTPDRRSKSDPLHTAADSNLFSN